MGGRAFRIGGVSVSEHAPVDADSGTPLVALTHGAGGDKDTPGLVALGDGLAARGLRALRFNLPAAEAGKRRPDRPAVAIRCIAEVAEELSGAGPLFLGGRSFGGRMVSEYLAGTDCVPVRGAIFLAYPLRPPGKAEAPENRVAHLGRIRVPALFLSGDRDPFAPEGFLEELADARKRVRRISGADHGFRVAKAHLAGRTPEEVREEVAGQVASFVADVLTGASGLVTSGRRPRKGRW